MEERRTTQRQRTLLGGKIVFNSGRSAIDCRVRNLSDQGGCLDVQTPARHSQQILSDRWRRRRPAPLRGGVAILGDRIGISFVQEGSGGGTSRMQTEFHPMSWTGSKCSPRCPPSAPRWTWFSSALSCWIDELRAQFINRAFRTMWRLPDAKADSKPPFVALMYHGRDTRAYAVAAGDVDALRGGARRAGAGGRHVKPMDHASAPDGEVLRFPVRARCRAAGGC